MVRYIDAAPTWEAILPILTEAVENGNEKGRKIAKEELLRMAQTADSYNALVKKDESSTTKTLESFENALSWLIAKYTGQISDDELTSALDMALSVQKELAKDRATES